MSPNNFLKYLLVGLALLLAIASKAQEIEWDKTYGAENYEYLYSIQQTSDGGYIIGGISLSGASGDKSEPSRGGYDYWVVKVDSVGNKEWDKTIGGSQGDFLHVVKQTPDGGYILGGFSESSISGDKTEPSRGVYYDYWIVKLDASGNIEWDRTYGGNSNDELLALDLTTDGGYLLGGTSVSDATGDKTEPPKGNEIGAADYWIIKLDEDGNKEWDKTIGGAGSDFLFALQQTNDGGFILGGESFSNAGFDKSEDARDNSYDYWIVKLDSVGNIEWNKTLGGNQLEKFASLDQTHDGGFIVGGHSYSDVSGDKTEPNRGTPDEPTADFWVVKLDTTGNVEWDKTLGGVEDESLYDLQQAKDGGYLLGGSSSSPKSSDKSEDPIGNQDFWIVKLDSVGHAEWDKTIGGFSFDALKSLEVTADGGYVLAGDSFSDSGADKSENSRGYQDYWIVKLSPEAPCTAPTSSIAVVPTSNVYTGGPATTIYLGYGPQRVQLVASGAGRYVWSPATGLNDASIANPVFTPTAPGTYRFTVTAYNGTCSSTASVEIEVIDVRCGNNKVTLCHRGRVICIPPSAAAAHLKHHSGDKLGACGSKQPDYAAPGFIVFPNPVNSLADIVWTLQEAGTFRIELYNANGLFVKQLARGAGEAGQEMQQQLDASRLPKGVYYIRLITSDEVRTIRLVVDK